MRKQMFSAVNIISCFSVQLHKEREQITWLLEDNFTNSFFILPVVIGQNPK